MMQSPLRGLQRASGGCLVEFPIYRGSRKIIRQTVILFPTLSALVALVTEVSQRGVQQNHGVSARARPRKHPRTHVRSGVDVAQLMSGLVADMTAAKAGG